MSPVNTGVSMKVSFIGQDYANGVYKSMTYFNMTFPNPCAHILAWPR